MKKLATFFTGPLGLLVCGFILTTVCGGVINLFYTRSTWEREKGFELFKADLVKHDDLLTQLTTIIGKRIFLLQRVVWAMDPPDRPEGTPAPETWSLNGEQQKELNDRWLKYYEAVANWNESYRTYAIKIRLLAGDKMADAFIQPDPVEGARKAKAGTLCGVVEATHKKVFDLKKKALSSSQVDHAEHDEAQHAIDNLYEKGDNYANDLYGALREKEASYALGSFHPGKNAGPAPP
jgi:hypothetical protein